MASAERNNSLLVREEYKEFDDDVFILHSGTGISEGKMLQLVNGGVNEKGKHTAVYLEFGATIGALQQGFTTLHPNIQNGTFNMITYGIIPPSVQESLRSDLPNSATERRVRERFRHSKGGFSAEEEYRRQIRFQKDTVTTDSVILSHAHPDHDGNIALLREDIPVVTSPQTRLLEALGQENNKKGWINEHVQFTTFPADPTKSEKRERDFIEISEGEIYRIGKEPGYFASLLQTDHWFGSHAIETYFPSGNRVLYTGDISIGNKTEALKKYMDDTPPVDLFVADATHVGKNMGKLMNELELLETFKDRFRKSGPHYVAMSALDMERLKTIMTASHESDKEVYISLQMAYFLKNLRDKMETGHPDVPDLSQLTVHLQPEKTGRYMDSDFKAHYRSVIRDESIKKIEQEDLHHSRPLARKAVILFSHPNEMDLFGSRSLFGRGRRLIYSTFNNNQYNPFDASRWSRVNKILNANNMSRETLNAIHHLGFAEFEDFIENHVEAENILLIPSRDPEFAEDIIKSKIKKRVNVLNGMQAGEPYFLNGQPLPRKAVSYPGRSA